VTPDLLRARRLTDGLFALVGDGRMHDRPIPERHRVIFYLGHLEAFDWNMVGRRTLGLAPISGTLDDLFAFGIDPPPGRLPEDRVEDWPSVGETRRYAELVRARVDDVFDQAPAEVRRMAVEHRLMHAETFSYILLNRPAQDAPEERPVEATGGSREAPGDSRGEAAWVDIPAGTARLGRRRGTAFGWDNEFGEVVVEVAAFRIARRKVTNGEYREFVEAGGAVPHYWRRRGSEWWLRTMRGERPLPVDWPVYASHDQAAAFAAWKGARLPTEAEYHRAAFGSPAERDGAAALRFPWGDELPSPRHGNFDFSSPDPVPVTATPGGDSAFGVSQLMGNGWEWTRTVFAPFPGFAAHPAYPGYSADFFDEGHYVLKGASPATDRLLLRPTFRNWFRPHYPYAYTTFRLVLD
jgi:gamma-glutamyl hercynylcysteine S-oxide synthase